MISATPRQRRHEKSRQAILDIATNLIVEHGYENLSLREIARQADYSPAGVYEYFKSKEDILVAIRDQVGGQMNLMLNTVPLNLPIRDRLTQLGLLYVQFAVSNMEQFQLMNALPSQRKSLAEPILRGSPYNIILQAVQTAIDAGDINSPKDYNAEEITYSLWALIHGIALLRLTHLRDFQADFEKIDRLAIETFLKGLG